MPADFREYITLVHQYFVFWMKWKVIYGVEKFVWFCSKMSLWSLFVILKSKYRPNYANDSSIFTGLISLLFKYCFGFICAHFVWHFFIPNEWHFSTFIIIWLHVHHLSKAFDKVWLSLSCPVIATASSGNCSQCLGIKCFKNWWPNCWKNLFRIYCINVFITILNISGLKQWPRITPFPILI